MNSFRFVLMFFCGAAIQAVATMMSRSVFSHGTFILTGSFFLASFGVFLGLMMINLVFVVGLERWLSFNRLLSHVVAAIVLAVLVVSYQVLEMGSQNLMIDAVGTLAVSVIVSLMTLAVRRFGCRAQ